MIPITKARSLYVGSQEMILNDDLTPQEIAELDLRIAGKLIKDLAFMLSRKVNHELLAPMSKWLDDQDWMIRFKVYEDSIPNWAEYKRQQREWTQQQKDLFRQRMKIYWQDFHKKRNMRREVAHLLNSKKGSSYHSIENAENQESEITKTQNYLSPVLQTYSPSEKHKRNTRQEFMQAMKQSISNLLPWRNILLSELNENPKDAMRLKDFKIYYMEDPHKDTASKLMHLLQLDSEGTITLSQSEPFGDIYVNLNRVSKTSRINTNTNTEPYVFSHDTLPISTPNLSNYVDTYQHDYPSEIKIKDNEGSTYNFDWRTLSNTQRNKVIADIKNNKILLCKVM
ncbi:hypothetical protein HQ545_04940 [Candidatus Woesearchaeota archaeon]|nr:hypothetical protein [Candidatus Woesearchaeota archaeon]